MSTVVGVDSSGSLEINATSSDEVGGRCLRARRAFDAGESLASFVASAVHDRPHRLTLQVAEHRHIELDPVALSFVNHSCAPNVFFDVERMELRALRPISEGEELTFFYPSTEWAMSGAFACGCGTSQCLKQIAGASQMPSEQLRGYRLAPHIVAMLERADRRANEAVQPPEPEPLESFETSRS